MKKTCPTALAGTAHPAHAGATTALAATRSAPSRCSRGGESDATPFTPPDWALGGQSTGSVDAATRQFAVWG